MYYLAVDIGASSGRHILGHIEDGKIIIEEVYRFENNFIDKKGTSCWDIKSLEYNIIEGLKKCKEIGKIPVSLGIDTWGVDFVLLDENDEILGDCVAYRDSRTIGMDNLVDSIVGNKKLYEQTGIQMQIFNTIYQFMAIKKNNPEHLEKAKSFLMMPEYFNYRLTGVKKNEYTIASTSGMLNAVSMDWDRDILDELDLPNSFLQKPYKPGETVDDLSVKVQEIVGFNCKVVLPPTHDTASAYVAVPALDDESVIISSGTWSLLGVENSSPITDVSAMESGFTNEGGYDGRYRFLKDIMGLWMIQSIRRELNNKYSFAELVELAKEEKDFNAVVNVNDQSFLSPKSMTSAIKEYCRKNNIKSPETVGQLAKCTYLSLAVCYKESIEHLEKITGKKFKSINIVGGGSQNMYLNELTAEQTGLPVLAGPTEGTALGNIIVQMIISKELDGLKSARQAIIDSFEIKTIKTNK